MSELKNPSPFFFPTLGDAKVATYQERRGKVHFIQADFFKKDWVGKDCPSQYDLVYDYTVRRHFPLKKK